MNQENRILLVNHLYARQVKFGAAQAFRWSSVLDKEKHIIDAQYPGPAEGGEEPAILVPLTTNRRTLPGLDGLISMTPGLSGDELDETDQTHRSESRDSELYERRGLTVARRTSGAGRTAEAETTSGVESTGGTARTGGAEQSDTGQHDQQREPTETGPQSRAEQPIELGRMAVTDRTIEAGRISAADRTVEAGRISAADRPIEVGRTSAADRPIEAGRTSAADRPIEAGRTSAADRTIEAGRISAADRTIDRRQTAAKQHTRRVEWATQDTGRGVQEPLGGAKRTSEAGRATEDEDVDSYHPQQLIDHATMCIYMERYNFPSRPACNGPGDNQPPLYWITLRELETVAGDQEQMQTRPPPRPRKRKR
ncbi:hypothetical protein H0H81_006755, partial [Sphagnurus paluster]